MNTQTQNAHIDKAMRVIPRVLQAKGLDTPREWLATERDGRRYLFGVMDVNRALQSTGSLKPYLDSNLTHDMSTLLGGAPVVLGNHSGLRYCVPLSAPPRLPANAPLPDSIPFDTLPLGVGFSGAISARPEVFISGLVTGAQGSGKSTFLKALAFSARAHSWRRARTHRLSILQEVFWIRIRRRPWVQRHDVRPRKDRDRLHRPPGARRRGWGSRHYTSNRLSPV
jgi:hypothetical protein